MDALTNVVAVLILVLLLVQADVSNKVVEFLENLQPATPEQVKDHVRKRIEIFSPGGGAVFNTVHNILPEVSPENIVAMFEAVDEYQ